MRSGDPRKREGKYEAIRSAVTQDGPDIQGGGGVDWATRQKIIQRKKVGGTVPRQLGAPQRTRGHGDRLEFAALKG